MDKLKPGLNTGFIPVEPVESDYIAGRVSGITYEARMPGDWEEFLPTEERQALRRFDTMACVTFSALNSIETQLYWMIKTGQIPQGLLNKIKGLGYLDANDRPNFSDRFTAKMSGTNTNGNTLPKVWDSIRHHGLLPEADWPTTKDMSRSEYFAEIPLVLKEKALEPLIYFNIQYEWIIDEEDENLNYGQKVYHLKQAPFQVATATCEPWGSGVIPACEAAASHATELYGITVQYHKDFDTYEPFKKKLAADYHIHYIMKGLLTLRTYELTTEMARFAWNKFKEIQDAFPIATGLISPIDPNYTLYDWCRLYGLYEHPDIFIENKLDWKGIDEILKPEDMKPEIPKKKENPLKVVLNFIINYFKTIWT